MTVAEQHFYSDVAAIRRAMEQQNELLAQLIKTQQTCNILFIAKDVDLMNGLTTSEQIEFFNAGIAVVKNNSSYDFYCLTQHGVKTLANFLIDYEQVENINELEDVYPGISNAI